VAPVVVRPDTASKKASVTDIAGKSARSSGTAPKLPSPSQNTAATRNPSRSRSSRLSLRAGNQAMSPATNVIAKASMNDERCPSA
jgi:hypothetical protein